MRKFFCNDYLTIVCRIVFGSIFIYASLDKISHPEQFARIVYNYHLLPASLINFFALVLPFSEFIAGFLLIVGLFYRGSRNYLNFLMMVFLVAIAINLFRGISLECGCFTVSSKAKTASYQLIIRDLVYLLPGIILLLSDSKRWMMDNILFRKVH